MYYIIVNKNLKKVKLKYNEILKKGQELFKQIKH